jgi:IclR family transcriptional regulator, acetate operon repressor
MAGSGGGRDMIGKALGLLDLLADHPAGIGVSQLARLAGYPVTTTHRLLASLARGGFVRGTDGRYSLGLRLFELGQRVSQARGFSGVALPIMQRVTERTRETTLMSVLDGDRQLYVHYVEGPRQVQITGTPGNLGPLHCTSMGKCLIAFQPTEVRRRLMAEAELIPFTPRTISDRDALAAEVERVRQRGWAVADEEHEEGIRAIGVPVLGPDGHAVAALSTAAPAYRTDPAALRDFLPALREAATELAALLPARR